MRRLIVSGLILAVALVAEEATQGYLLGLHPRLAPLCDAIGGKHASVPGRCITRLCYRFGDCGHWATPARWANRLKPGDSESEVVFWLGEPVQRLVDDLSWDCCKASVGMLRAKMRDGRLVHLQGCSLD